MSFPWLLLSFLFGDIKYNNFGQFHTPVMTTFLLHSLFLLFETFVALSYPLIIEKIHIYITIHICEVMMEDDSI